MTSWSRALSMLVHRRVVFPAVLALRGELGTYPALRELESRQWDDPEILLGHQEDRLKETITHAARTVPLYRARWKMDPAERQAGDAFELLRQLPVLTKGDLQEQSAALRSEQSPLWVTKKTTGGSTGEPVTVVKDRKAIARERATSWLAYGWFDVEIGDRGARFWGSPTDLGRRRLRYAAADLAMNRIRFSAFAFEEEDLEAYWKRCLRWQPAYLHGYLSMLTEFARHLQEQNHDGSRLDLKLVISTAEALAPPQRSLLEKVFDAPVQNEYGCGEVGPIAYECPVGNLHVMSDNVIVEIVREDGSPAPAGEPGSVLLTDLNNRAMPLVRYQVGDHAVRSDEACPCGRGFPVLEEVRGRAYDFVRDREGKRFHGEFFMYLFEDLRDRGAKIDQFRVTQHSEDLLEVDVVSSQELSEEEENFLRGRVDRNMTGMRVTVSRVEEIERLDSGKTRVIRNVWLANDTT